jgi:hypothetical protein
MASINIAGDTSGTITLSAPLVAGSNTVTLPAATGTISLLTQATAVASTSGTSIDFTGIPSWVKRITVMFSNVSTNGTSPVQVQLGDSGGIETTGYYSSVFSWTGGSQATNVSSGFSLCASGVGTAGNQLYGALTISNHSGNVFVASGTITTTSVNGAVSYVAGGKETSATLDRIRITTINGTDTFDAGSINVMWEG